MKLLQIFTFSILFCWKSFGAGENIRLQGAEMPDTTIPITSFDDTIELDLQRSDIIARIPDLVENGLIPCIDIENLYIEDITAKTSGALKQQIILIGKHSEQHEPQILYILKKIRTNPSKAHSFSDGSTLSNTEIESIKTVYRAFAERTVIQRLKSHKNALIRANVENHDGQLNTYQMKLAWHERIFQDQSNPRDYYELLHAAKGTSISHFNLPTENFNFFERQTNQPILDYDRISDLYRDYDTILKNIFNRNLWRVFLSGSLDNFRETVTKEALDLHDTNISSAENFLSLYRKIPNTPTGLLFETRSSGPILVDMDWEKARLAYEALGGCLGSFFKEYKIPYNTSSLDPHHNNMFFDESKKTVTWIDLHWLGEYFSKNEHLGIPALKCALNDTIWKDIFSKFTAGVEAFYPDADEHAISLLQHERDRLFNNVKNLYETFFNAFMQNYNPHLEYQLKAYFKSNFIYPFNDHPNWGSESASKFNSFYLSR